MASQKEKYLNSAQKFIQKGQLERAIKDYEQIVAADPKDVRQRQKLAELLARCNRNEEAAREYDTIAKYYEENGFYLKAIAVYKQIQKIDGENIDIYFKLAELNEKQGLVGNALSEYKNVYDHYEKAGLPQEAIKILEKMHLVDKENVDIRLKLAEMKFAAGRRDDAYEGYTRAALLLKSRGNEPLFEKVCARIHKLFPAKKDFLFDILEEEVKNGSAADVVPRLRGMLENDGTNRRLLALLAQACAAVGDGAGSKDAWSRLLRHFPHDTPAKLGLIACVIAEEDLEESLGILEQYATGLLDEGSFAPLEKFYACLQVKAPYDTRILRALKNLYEMSGDQAKLADVQVSLNILSGSVSGKEAVLTDHDGNDDEPVRSVEGMPGITEIDFPWEEDVELTLPGDDADRPDAAGCFGDELDLEAAAPVVGLGENGEQEGGFEPYTLDLEDLAVLPEAPDVAGMAMGDLPLDFSAVSLETAASAEESGTGEPVADLSLLELDDAVLEDVPGENAGDWLSDHPSPAAGAGGDTDAAPGEPSGGDFPGPGYQNAPDGIADDTDRQLPNVDTETHFNLGIAYKEMGLFDEALNEFAIATADPARLVDCMILQAICLREKGEPWQAEEILKSGIDRYGQEPEKFLNLKYELGLLYDAAGRNDDALRIYREVFVTDPGFRDAAEKIALLHGAGGLPDLSDIDDVDIELEEIQDKRS